MNLHNQHLSQTEAGSPLQAAATQAGPKGMAIADNRPVRNAASGTVQRVITEGATPHEKSTLRTIRKQPLIGAKVAAVVALIRMGIGDEVNETWLERSWNDEVKLRDYDIDTQQDILVANVIASYRRSEASGKAKQARGEDADIIYRALAAVDPDLVPVQQGREQVIAHKHPHALEAPQANSAATMAARHAATVVLAKYPSGVEVQGAMQHDGMGMLLSSNKNKANDDIRGQLKIAAHLKNVAAELLIKADVMSKGLDKLMSDRVLRHAAKLYLEISRVMASDAPITVPGSVVGDLDGLHAEIRIELDEWSEETHELPYGTRLPCMGCYLYFNSQRIQLGKWMGPLWASNPGMAKQMEDLLRAKVRMGKMGAVRAKAVGDKIAATYAQLPDDTGLAHSKKRDGTYTYNHDPDSESDLDAEEHADLVKRLKARQSGTPSSPQWDGIESWSSPFAASSSAQGSLLDDDAENDELQHVPKDELQTAPEASLDDIFEEDDLQQAPPAVRDTLPLGLVEPGLDGAGSIKIMRQQLPHGFTLEEGVEIWVGGVKKKVHYYSVFNGKITMDYVPA